MKYILTAILVLLPYSLGNAQNAARSSVQAQFNLGTLPCGEQRQGMQCAVAHPPGYVCDYEAQFHRCRDRCKCFGECDSMVMVTFDSLAIDSDSIGNWFIIDDPAPVPPEHRVNIDTLIILDTVFTAWEQECRRCPKYYYHDTQIRALMVIDSVFRFDRVDTMFTEVEP